MEINSVELKIKKKKRLYAKLLYFSNLLLFITVLAVVGLLVYIFSINVCDNVINENEFNQRSNLTTNDELTGQNKVSKFNETYMHNFDESFYQNSTITNLRISKVRLGGSENNSSRFENKLLFYKNKPDIFVNYTDSSKSYRNILKINTKESINSTGIKKNEWNEYKKILIDDIETTLKNIKNNSNESKNDTRIFENSSDVLEKWLSILKGSSENFKPKLKISQSNTANPKLKSSKVFKNDKINSKSIFEDKNSVLINSKNYTRIFESNKFNNSRIIYSNGSLNNFFISNGSLKGSQNIFVDSKIESSSFKKNLSSSQNNSESLEININGSKYFRNVLKTNISELSDKIGILTNKSNNFTNVSIVSNGKMNVSNFSSTDCNFNSKCIENNNNEIKVVISFIKKKSNVSKSSSSVSEINFKDTKFRLVDYKLNKNLSLTNEVELKHNTSKVLKINQNSNKKIYEASENFITNLEKNTKLSEINTSDISKVKLGKRKEKSDVYYKVSRDIECMLKLF